jgi:hypothetical protein
MYQALTCQPFSGDLEAPRIGGPALLPADLAWPVNPLGDPLYCVASLPGWFLDDYAGFDLGPERFVTIFTTYSTREYFLDRITELDWVRAGFTRVLVHGLGPERIEADAAIPLRDIAIARQFGEDAEINAGAKIGGVPGLVQNEVPNLDGARYALQFYGADFPVPFDDIFYHTDALGYLWLNGETGTFLVQTG